MSVSSDDVTDFLADRSNTDFKHTFFEKGVHNTDQEIVPDTNHELQKKHVKQMWKQ